MSISIEEKADTLLQLMDLVHDKHKAECKFIDSVYSQYKMCGEISDDQMHALNMIAQKLSLMRALYGREESYD